MAEVTWKATFIGAFVLFLIGVVAATCLNYAEAALVSIAAGISGPFKCHYNASDPNSRLNKTVLCNETELEYLIKESCIYIYVSYQPKHKSEPIKNIKLSPSYTYNNPQTTGKLLLGECSAKYCGTYRFKDPNNTSEYQYHPDLIQEVNKAEKETDGEIKCYLNTKDVKAGAYLHLNEVTKVKKPQQRIFRWYEGWLILLSPVAISLGIILFLTVTFLRGRMAAQSVQKPRAFVPPGLAPMTTEMTPMNISQETRSYTSRHDEPHFV